jgi:uncharacterized membrane protein
LVIKIVGRFDQKTGQAKGYMSQLIALLFDDQFKAEEARDAIHRMADEGLLELNDTVLVKRRLDGKVTVSQEDKVIAEGQTVGHVAGLIAAAATGSMPFILPGTVAGRLVGRLKDHGTTREFVKNLRREVEPGTSALIVVAESDPERQSSILEHLQEFEPRILESDLPLGLEDEIENEIEGRKAA